MPNRRTTSRPRSGAPATGSTGRGSRVQPERELMAQAIELLRAEGWLVYHTFDSRRSPAGFPDLVCIRGGRLLAIECKSTTGRATDAQLEWLRAFAAIPGGDAFILRPGATMDALGWELMTEGRT